LHKKELRNFANGLFTIMRSPSEQSQDRQTLSALIGSMRWLEFIRMEKKIRKWLGSLMLKMMIAFALGNEKPLIASPQRKDIRKVKLH
jgi:hypothetical protein